MNNNFAQDRNNNTSIHQSYYNCQSGPKKSQGINNFDSGASQQSNFFKKNKPQAYHNATEEYETSETLTNHPQTGTNFETPKGLNQLTPEEEARHAVYKPIKTVRKSTNDSTWAAATDFTNTPPLNVKPANQSMRDSRKAQRVKNRYKNGDLLKIQPNSKIPKIEFIDPAEVSRGKPVMLMETNTETAIRHELAQRVIAIVNDNERLLANSAKRLDKFLAEGMLDRSSDTSLFIDKMRADWIGRMKNIAKIFKEIELVNKCSLPDDARDMVMKTPQSMSRAEMIGDHNESFY